ncbi:unnamed protein product, partial [Sphacelaria rigidula]
MSSSLTGAPSQGAASSLTASPAHLHSTAREQNTGEASSSSAWSSSAGATNASPTENSLPIPSPKFHSPAPPPGGMLSLGARQTGSR